MTLREEGRVEEVGDLEVARVALAQREGREARECRWWQVRQTEHRSVWTHSSTNPYRCSSLKEFKYF